MNDLKNYISQKTSILRKSAEHHLSMEKLNTELRATYRKTKGRPSEDTRAIEKRMAKTREKMQSEKLALEELSSQIPPKSEFSVNAKQFVEHLKAEAGNLSYYVNFSKVYEDDEADLPLGFRATVKIAAHGREIFVFPIDHFKHCAGGQTDIIDYNYFMNEFKKVGKHAGFICETFSEIDPEFVEKILLSGENNINFYDILSTEAAKLAKFPKLEAALWRHAERIYNKDVGTLRVQQLDERIERVDSTIETLRQSIDDYEEQIRTLTKNIESAKKAIPEKLEEKRQLLQERKNCFASQQKVSDDELSF